MKAAREAGATGVWTNLLFLRPGTREHFLEHLAEDWPELVPHYQELYSRRAYVGAAESRPVRQQVSAFAREFGVADRRVSPVEPEQRPEQLASPCRRIPTSCLGAAPRFVLGEDAV